MRTIAEEGVAGKSECSSGDANVVVYKSFIWSSVGLTSSYNADRGFSIPLSSWAAVVAAQRGITGPRWLQDIGIVSEHRRYFR
jgi:hypothetical protein